MHEINTKPEPEPRPPGKILGMVQQTRIRFPDPLGKLSEYPRTAWENSGDKDIIRTWYGLSTISPKVGHVYAKLYTLLTGLTEATARHSAAVDTVHAHGDRYQHVQLRNAHLRANTASEAKDASNRFRQALDYIS